MLYDKVLEARHGKGREIIGLIGTHHGTGVTHTGLMLAFYMGEEIGRKTAFLECNDHQDMRLIQNAYEWSAEEKASFSFHQITCYKEVDPKRISEIFGENYECIIFDFGTDFAANREEFLRCRIKIVVGGGSEWDIQKLVRFMKATQVVRGSDAWLYFIPRANERNVLKISKEINRRVWTVPVSEEPTIPSHITNRFFDRIF
jgi:1,4-alpha-glucan branching enzyme